MVAGGRTKLYEGFDTSKHYHGDLMERAMNLLLALTGNWGRKGTGHDTYLTHPFDGSYLQSLKPGPGIEAAEAVVQMLRGHLRRGPRARTAPIPPPPLPLPVRRSGTSWRMAAAGGSTTPPFFLWLDHAGYREVFERADWGDSPRPIRRVRGGVGRRVGGRCTGPVPTSNPGCSSRAPPTHCAARGAAPTCCSSTCGRSCRWWR